MKNISLFDKIVIDNTFKKCVDCGFEKYSQIAYLLNKSESFVKAVFSAGRKKLNLYHLMKLSYALNCDIKDFLPSEKDYKSHNISFKTEKEAFYISIGENE